MPILNKNDINIKNAAKDAPGQDLPILGTGPKWAPADKGYHDMIAKAANKYGVPVDLAIRQAAQESAHFDPKVISGKVKSGAGATGLFQFMPATAAGFKLNPTDPVASADTAMRYMAYLYKKFGDWKKAAWAYNWGEGNLAKFLRGQKTLPKETRLYGLIVAEGYTPTQAKATAPSVK